MARIDGENLIESIYFAMDGDDEDRDKQSAKLVAVYEEATPNGRQLLNEAFTCLCGWTLATLLGVEEPAGPADPPPCEFVLCVEERHVYRVPIRRDPETAAAEDLAEWVHAADVNGDLPGVTMQVVAPTSWSCVDREAYIERTDGKPVSDSLNAAVNTLVARKAEGGL